MKLDLQTRPTAPTFDLTASNLNALGLREDDVAEVQQVALRLQPTNPLSVAEFGRDVAEHTSRYADGLLEQVRNNVKVGS